MLHCTNARPRIVALVAGLVAACGEPHPDTTPTEIACVDCHRIKYDVTQAPVHAEAGFPTTCVDCHETSAWQPAKIDWHDQRFPIASGNHAKPCIECHTTPGKYAEFACTGSCHSQSNRDASHKAVTGYAWESAKCYSCHPDGKVNFDHAAYFPIAAAPHNLDCAQCHIDPTNKKSFSCTSGGCHTKASRDSSHVGVAGYVYESAQCYKCHPDGAASVNHDPFFPIQNAPHDLTCASCHTTPGNKKAFSCVDGNCHAQPARAPAHNGLVGYVWQSASCYACHPDGNAVAHGPLFPIKSGKHHLACASCHTDSKTFSSFTCMSSGCHPKGKTDEKHWGEVSGYTYSAAACYDCHPTGKGD